MIGRPQTHNYLDSGGGPFKNEYSKQHICKNLNVKSPWSGRGRWGGAIVSFAFDHRFLVYYSNRMFKVIGSL